MDTQPLRKEIQVFSELHVTLSKEVYLIYPRLSGFSGGSDSKESACNAGDLGLIPGSGRSHGEGNSYSLQKSCLENAVDSPWGHKESDTTEQLTLSLSLTSTTNRHLPRALPTTEQQRRLPSASGDWTPHHYTSWPSTTPEGVQHGVRHSMLQGIWWDRSLDSWVFLGIDFMISILASPHI